MVPLLFLLVLRTRGLGQSALSVVSLALTGRAVGGRGGLGVGIGVLLVRLVCGTTVVYKGPFREIADDLGNVYPRGQRVTVDATAATRLRSPEWSQQLLVLG